MDFHSTFTGNFLNLFGTDYQRVFVTDYQVNYQSSVAYLHLLDQRYKD